MGMSNAEFAATASPHSWLLSADLLHAQAVAIYATRGTANIYQLKVKGKSKPILEMNAADKAIFLLGGCALENALKAFLVFENPVWVDKGKLDKKLQSHKLSKLSAHSKFAPYKSRFMGVLASFEEGVESWARYPCHLDAGRSSQAKAMTDTLWEGYLAVMGAYGQRLSELLSVGWRNPDGGQEHWSVGVGFLEMIKTKPRRKSPALRRAARAATKSTDKSGGRRNG